MSQHTGKKNKKNQSCKSLDQSTSLKTTSSTYHGIPTNSNSCSIQNQIYNAPKDPEQSTKKSIQRHFISTEIRHRAIEELHKKSKTQLNKPEISQQGK